MVLYTEAKAVPPLIIAWKTADDHGSVNNNPVMDDPVSL